MIPLYDVLPRRRSPVLRRALIAACIGAFIWTLEDPEVLNRLGAVPFHYTGQLPIEQQFDLEPAPGVVADDGRRWLRAVTHMFLHANLLHLLGNMWFLKVFGDNVEDRLGHARFLLLYLLAGGAALAAQTFAEPKSGYPMIGASGAIGGVLGAYLILFPRASVMTLIPISFVPLLVPIPAVIFLCIWLAMQLFGAFFNQGSNVAFFAHLGGFAMGAVLALAIAPRDPDKAPERVKRR